MRSARRRGDEHLHRQADELGGLPPEDLGCLTVGVIDQSVGPDHQGRIGSSLKEKPSLVDLVHFLSVTGKKFAL